MDNKNDLLTPLTAAPINNSTTPVAQEMSALEEVKASPLPEQQWGGAPQQSLPAPAPQQQPQQVVYMPAPAAPAIADARLTSRGLDPANGTYSRQKYCGVLSVVIGVFALPCICCVSFGLFELR